LLPVKSVFAPLLIFETGLIRTQKDAETFLLFLTQTISLQDTHLSQKQRQIVEKVITNKKLHLCNLRESPGKIIPWYFPFIKLVMGLPAVTS
jgi:hypothetical protein